MSAEPDRKRPAAAPLPLAGACAAVLFLLASQAPAAKLPVFALGRVTAVGGNEILGVPGGVLFEQAFGPGCRRQPAAAAKPLSGALSSDMSLALEVTGCPEGAPPPLTTTCRARVGNRESGQSFAGWRGTVALPLPDRTGIYPLQLRCSTGDGPEISLVTTLYLTYGSSRPSVAPAPEAWYRLVCAWGGGLAAHDPEPWVLEKILHGLYGFGERRWRYGYCTVEDSQCVFGTPIPVSTPGLICPDAAESGGAPADGSLCRCDWRFMLKAGGACDFTDCFGISEAFQDLAATMGIGGLEDRTVEGIRGLGFSTHGWLRTFDPSNRGNFLCGLNRTEPCSFLFAVHDLRQRDGTLYDSTFGRLYSGIGELLAGSILTPSGPDGILLTNARACFLLGEPYGGFPPLRELPLIAPSCPRDLTGPASFVPGTSMVALDRSGGGAALAFHFKVRIHAAGRYAVEAQIVGGPERDLLVVARRGPRLASAFPERRIDGSPGEQAAELHFTASDLAGAEIPGPYWVKALLLSEKGVADETEVEVPPLPLAALAEKPMARLGEPREPPELLRLADRGTVLRLRVPVEVGTAGSYAVDGRIALRGETLGYAGMKADLKPGDGVLVLDFPLPEELVGAVGPFAVTVDLDSIATHRRAGSLATSLASLPGAGGPSEVP